jgi:DNA-binding HxlR family transcriptional regulator
MWTTRILWFLDCGPRRFGDLRRDLETISAKVLTQRLRAMEAKGLIARRRLATSPVQVEYRLTALGREFHPVLAAMVRISKGMQMQNRRAESAAQGGLDGSSQKLEPERDVA